MSRACRKPVRALCPADIVQDMQVDSTREPMFNIPGAVMAVIVLLGAVHATLGLLLSDEDARQVLLLFSFIPARYAAAGDALPGGIPAGIWSFVSYALLHADLSHLVLNSISLLAFGTPVARRFGSLRFMAFLALTAAAGALAHLMVHAGEMVPVIGASAAVSGTIAAATRFAFEPGGPLGPGRERAEHPDRIPAPSLFASIRNPRALTFMLFWFGLNALIGLAGLSLSGIERNVAWEAHIGGFVAGLIAFSFFDPVPRRSASADPAGR
jgi:membrane associated rhomboid family serine protease